MKTLVIAPHADDEVLGCGGTLLRLKDQDAEIGWCLVSEMTKAGGYSACRMEKREAEILEVCKCLGLQQNNLFRLGYKCAQLDTYEESGLVSSIAKVLSAFKPEQVFIPWHGDVHSDHKIVARCALSSLKSFRQSSVKRVLAYEVVSETNFASQTSVCFQPNFYCDISPYLEEKIRIASVYASEMKPHPFPRSEVSIRALAHLRGSEASVVAAESFVLVKEIL